MPNRLSTQDASFLYAETVGGPMHGATISSLEGEATFDAIYNHIATRIHLIPRYRQRLMFVPFNLAHPVWVDDPDFDLRNHIIEHELPGESTFAQAVEFALELNEPLLDRTRPLWALHVIHGVPGHTILLQMGHHAMVDGVTGVALSMIMLDLDPDAPPPPPPESPWDPKPLPSRYELIQDAVRDNLASMRESASTLSSLRSNSALLRHGARAMMRFFNEPAILAPWNRGMVGPKRRLAWMQHSFAEFREIRRVFGGTINDVVLAVVSEGAARYLAAHNEQVDKEEFRIMCPVNVRREDEEGELGNRVSGIFPMLPARPMGIVERLQTVGAEVASIKANKEAQGLQLMMDSMPETPPVAMAPTLLVGTAFDPSALLSRIPPPRVQAGGSKAPFFGFNFTCTNVPGVQVPQYIAGHKIEHMVVTLMLGGTLGFGVAVVSYNQDLYFNLISDPRLMDDPDIMRDFVDEAFQELLAAARSGNMAAAG